jgi:hypothetical protein
MASNGLGGHTALMGRLVRQHWFTCDVANGIDGRLGGAALGINVHKTAPIHFHACGFEAQTARVRRATHGYQHFFEDVLCTVDLRTFQSYSDALRLFLHSDHFCVE